jgi:hypothetical protein
MKVLCAIICMAAMLSGQVVFEEYFTDGNMQLDWHPWFTDSLGLGDSMTVINDPSTPGGDSWAGRISNEYMGVAGLTYAGESWLTDYTMEAWIYTVVSASMGPYNGIAVRLDSVSRYYYRLVSDFDMDGRLRLGLVGSGGYPVILRDWTSGEIPGGVPATSSWHKLKLQVHADSIWAYYDDVLLADCPIINDSVSKGYFGVYTFNMLDTASTKCDNIFVLDLTGISEGSNETVTNCIVAPNPFSATVRIGINTTYSGEEFVHICDVTGRVVQSMKISDHSNPSVLIWDGQDSDHQRCSPGVYFIKYGRIMKKVVKLD